jgi:hypothetical protein
MKMHTLHDTSKKGGSIRFVRPNGSIHEFSSWVNSLTGDRLSAFDNNPPTVNDSLSWVKSVFRDIQSKNQVVAKTGNIGN